MTQGKFRAQSQVSSPKIERVMPILLQVLKFLLRCFFKTLFRKNSYIFIPTMGKILKWTIGPDVHIHKNLPASRSDFCFQLHTAPKEGTR